MLSGVSWNGLHLVAGPLEREVLVLRYEGSRRDLPTVAGVSRCEPWP